MLIKKIIISLLILASFSADITFLYITSLFTCMYILFENKFKINKKIILKISFLLALNLIALISVKFMNKDIYAILKDVTYFTVPILTIFIGTNFKKIVKNIEEFLTVFVFWGVSFAVVHIYNYISTNASVESIYEVRSEVGNGNVITVLALCFTIIYFDEFKKILKYNKLFYIIILSVLSTSLLLSLSRTFIFAVLACVLIAIYLNFNSNIKIKNIINTILVVTLIVPIFLIFLNQNNQTNELIMKITNSFQEIKVSNYITDYEINNNWRGYESYRAFIKFENGSAFEKLFGFGFGSEVDLGLEIKLGDSLMTSIPILHNGLVYLLVKSGILGLAVYFAFLVYSICRSAYKFYAFRSKATALSLLLITITFFNSFTVTGIFNPGFSIVLLLYFYMQSLDENTNFKVIKNNEISLKEMVK